MDKHLYLPIGPRVLTFYVYVETSEDLEGGALEFSDLFEDTKIKPEFGKALLWSNVKNINPNRDEDRSTHKTEHVTKGEMYVANLWYHMYNFHGPYQLACSG